MSEFIWSPTKLLDYLSCRQKFYYRHVRRLRTRNLPMKLVFGKSVHAGAEAHLLRPFTKGPVDLERVFTSAWDSEVKTGPVGYDKDWDETSIKRCGTTLMRQFPQVWDLLGLVPVMGPDGKPMVEQMVTFEVAPGVKVRCKLDALLLDVKTGEVCVLDFKSSSSKTDPELALVSAQLATYQLACEAIGIRVHKLGYMPLLKKKRAPEVLAPAWVPARSRAELDELRRKYLWADEDVKAQRFARDAGNTHDSPCRLCDFKDYCLHGKVGDLIIPAAKLVVNF